MVLFMDGASHYSVAELGLKYAAFDAGGATWDVLAEGRTDGCVKKTNTAGPAGFLTITPLFTQAGVWTPRNAGLFGCALKITNLATIEPTPSIPGPVDFRNIFFSVYYGAFCQFGVSINQNGTFSVYPFHGIPAVPFATSVQGVTEDTWAYVEFQWTIDNTSGTCSVYVNGTPILSFVGPLRYQGLLGPPPDLWNSVNIMGQASGGGSPVPIVRMCDVYLADTVIPNGARLGDISIAYIKPDGVGAIDDWAPSAGANWECVDEVPPNSDTDYVETTTPGDRDSYSMEDVVGDPLAIQVCMFARVTSVGAASIQPGFRIGGVEYDGNVQGLGSSGYGYKLQTYDTNPATMAAWTKTVLDATESGPLKAT